MKLPSLNGLDLQKRIIDRVDVPIIFITGHGDVPTAVEAMKAGAVDFCEPSHSAMRCCWMPSAKPSIAAARRWRMRPNSRALRERYTSLTQRERQTMALVVSGLLNKQIAAELGISEITVKAHRGRVMRKMRVESLAALVRAAAALDLRAHRPSLIRYPTNTMVQ